jgi:PKD repeat protein
MRISSPVEHPGRKPDTLYLTLLKIILVFVLLKGGLFPPAWAAQPDIMSGPASLFLEEQAQLEIVPAILAAYPVAQLAQEPAIYDLPVTVTASPSTVGRGDPAHISVTVRFADGTLAQDALVTVTTERSGATLSPASGFTGPDGSFTTEFMSRGSGTFVLTASAEWMPAVFTLKEQSFDKLYQGTASTWITVVAGMPVAIIDARPPSGHSPLTVTLDGSRSYSPDGTIASHRWTFGDGGEGSGSVVVHTYQEPGAYEATLTITDTWENTASASTIIRAEHDPPVAIIDAEPPSGRSPLTVTFDGWRSYSPDGTITSYLWSFGDGKTGGGSVTRHIYQEPGAYEVTLLVTDTREATASASTIIRVDNSPPVASISVLPHGETIPLTVILDGGNSYDTDGYIVRYQWDFDDGSISLGSRVTHTFRQPGRHKVVLTVTDDAMSTGSASMEILGKSPFPWYPLVVGIIGIATVAGVYRWITRRKPIRVELNLESRGGIDGTRQPHSDIFQFSVETNSGITRDGECHDD